MSVAPPRVLLISESRITRRVVEMTFADQAVELVTAVTSQEGLAAWEDRPATVVLADLAMDAPPDGLAVARHVQAHAGDRPVAVLLMAGPQEAVDDTEMAAAGVRGVLRKPLDSLQLIEAVRGAMRGSRGQAPWAPPGLPDSIEPPAPGVLELSAPAAAAAVASSEEPAVITMDDPTMPHPLRDEDLERVAARVAAIWSGDEDRERRLASLLADRAEQAAAASAAAAAERVAPAATSEAAERLVRELAPALVAEVARLVVADVSERLVREEIARMRSASAGR